MKRHLQSIHPEVKKLDPYLIKMLHELREWQLSMQKKPSFINNTTKRIQLKINNIIPGKVQNLIIKAMQQMTKAVIAGAGFTTRTNNTDYEHFEAIESVIKERIKFYRTYAAAEGAVTGYGGFWLSFADLPLWLSIKMKMLFDIANRYGFDTKDPRERVFILYIFQIAFSSQKHRNKVYNIISDWENQKELLPKDLNKLDWKSYWEEYRDHVDLAKLVQIIPTFGAAVGILVNYRYTNRLGNYAMNAYRLRLVNQM